MSGDYWRNEDKTATLSFFEKGIKGQGEGYYLCGEWDNDITYCKLTNQDMVNLRNSLNFLLSENTTLHSE